MPKNLTPALPLLHCFCLSVQIGHRTSILRLPTLAAIAATENIAVMSGLKLVSHQMQQDYWSHSMSTELQLRSIAFACCTWQQHHLSHNIWLQCRCQLASSCHDKENPAGELYNNVYLRPVLLKIAAPDDSQPCNPGTCHSCSPCVPLLLMHA